MRLKKESRMCCGAENLRSDIGVLLLIGDRLRHLGGGPGVDLWVGGGMLRAAVLLVSALQKCSARWRARSLFAPPLVASESDGSAFVWLSANIARLPELVDSQVCTGEIGDDCAG